MFPRFISLLAFILLLCAHGNAFRIRPAANLYDGANDNSTMEHHVIRERVKRRSRDCSVKTDVSLLNMNLMSQWAEEVMVRSLLEITVSKGGKPTGHDERNRWPRGIVPYKFDCGIRNKPLNVTLIIGTRLEKVKLNKGPRLLNSTLIIRTRLLNDTLIIKNRLLNVTLTKRTTLLNATLIIGTRLLSITLVIGTRLLSITLVIGNRLLSITLTIGTKFLSITLIIGTRLLNVTLIIGTRLLSITLLIGTRLLNVTLII
ncbi:hypothetical protein RRG08_045159 [Elysia crispata]|uniref:Uncharacterized protein n=1 Tax=Elysia crispata TaxID=231223 RepID=A0AAE1DRL7_9GAST|nr:hypothetical protein RRG08_045159 [Elysia crispata]